MAKLPKTRSAMERAGQNIDRDLRAKLTQNGQVASKALYKSISHTVKTRTYSASLEGTAKEYWVALDGTDGNGKPYQPSRAYSGGHFLNSIQKWISVKGIKSAKYKSNKALAKAITNSIYKRGHKKPLKPFVRPVLDKYDKKLTNDISEAYIEDIFDLINKRLKQ